jgi:1-acyl-sn-glycerol-3-phosphate acyltransferase
VTIWSPFALALAFCLLPFAFWLQSFGYTPHVRRLVTRFFRLCLLIFYRRIEIIGLHRVPDRGAVVFASNHPNGLVDPLFLLCLAPRPVSFLGKAPLMKMFFVGWVARKFETIPVYRRQDRTKGSNEETFEAARSVLNSNGAIAIFPEGTTHSDPRLRELKTGAARIALGAELDGVTVVPTGIYYKAKHRFRSEAMLVFGEPIHVRPATLDENGEPPRDAVDGLTARIDDAIDAVTLQADSHAALELIGLAEDLYSADEKQPLSEELDLRRQFIESYRRMRERDPARLERLESMVGQLDAELRAAHLEVHDLRGVRIRLWALFRAVILLPLALIGGLISFPAWKLVGLMARRFSKGEDALLATVKLIAALALYPLSWIVFALAIGFASQPLWGAVALFLMPGLSFIALRVFEELDQIIGDVRAFWFTWFQRQGHAQLVAQQEAIRREFLAVARERS